MKRRILHSLYQSFHLWSADYTIACKKGCSACCTQNVTITALEGEEILEYIQEQNMSKWLAEKLNLPPAHTPAQLTNNDFACACLQGKEVEYRHDHSTAPCPFLEDDLCKIYQVRPFACRLFISTTPCSTTRPARMIDAYVEASTTLNQLIEHLGQKGIWGNMLDVLPALCKTKFKDIGMLLKTRSNEQAFSRCRTARPLPGFLLSEEEGPKVVELLDTIFNTTINNKRIEDFLNNR